MQQILKAFNLESIDSKIQKFGPGLINDTFLVIAANEKYILQKINTEVFQNPETIGQNLNEADKHLKSHYPTYLFISQIKTSDGENFFVENGNYWRLTKFIDNSYSINTVNDPEMAFEAARAFGELTVKLQGLDLAKLKPSIPHFHDLSMRYEQFKLALQNASPELKADSKTEIDFYESNNGYVETFRKIQQDETYPDRMIHHDTKINNVLFDKQTQKSLCVCDLDTLMPGKIISDLGDMVRTYSSAESEESTEFEHVKIRLTYIEALMNGYLGKLKKNLTPSEKESLIFAGPFMIYMQGLRFLTDHLNGDVYYQISYKNQNLNRAKNQQALLEEYQLNQTKIATIIAAILS